MPIYPGISSEAFRHPLDRQAEQALRSVPGFDLVASNFVQYFYERPQQVFLLGNNIRVSSRQYATVYGIFRECLSVLDIAIEPTLYVSQNPVVNSYALGHERPYIVVHSGLLDLLDEAEIRVVLAHELGHIKCDHTLLIQMAMWAMGAASLLGELTLGLGNVISSSLIYAFYEWRRKAELSADRAAMLVIDDLKTIFLTMMKMAGGSQRFGHECSLEEFMAQAESYENLDQDGLNQLYKFLIYNGGNGGFLTHPFPVERLSYLQSWADSKEYTRIKQGHYSRVAEEGSINVNNQPNNDEAEALKRQIEALQSQIDQLRSQSKEI